MALYSGNLAGGVSPQKFDANMEELKDLIQDVDNQVDEVLETVELMPAATIPPSLETFTAQSQEDGIKLTYKPRFVSGRLNATQEECWIFSQTKGIMFRYSEEGYPKNRNEGVLAFIDEDIFTITSDGIIQPKTKSKTIVGLTTNTKYYISAFPYSTYNVYNELLKIENGLNNAASCTWVGTKATLTVTITQDLDLFEFGEITVTLTPQASGEAMTQSRTGPGDVIFSGVTAGTYTISFSSVTNYTAPVSQEIEIMAGVPNNKTFQYTLNNNLSDYTWEQIIDFSESGIASQLFSVNDTKKLPLSGNYNYQITMEILGFNHDDLASGGKAGITFACKNCMNENKRMNSRANNYFVETELYETLNGAIFNSFPQEVRNGIKTVKKKSSEINSEYGNNRVSTDEMKVFLLSDSELGVPHPDVPGQGDCYAKFVNNDSRKKGFENNPTQNKIYWTRSFNITQSYEMFAIGADGTKTSEVVDDARGVCFGFCV